MSKFVNAPIQRHEALVPLSRDHFTGLAHAQRLIKSAPKDRVSRHKALSGFIDAWNTEIAAHFDDEERLFLNDLNQADAERLLSEHTEIRALADEAKELKHSVDPNPQRVEHIGRTLNDHIRWEERELFGRIEKSLSEEQLKAMAQDTARIEATRARFTNKSESPGSQQSDTTSNHNDCEST